MPCCATGACGRIGWRTPPADGQDGPRLAAVHQARNESDGRPRFRGRAVLSCLPDAGLWTEMWKTPIRIPKNRPKSPNPGLTQNMDAIASVRWRSLRASLAPGECTSGRAYAPAVGNVLPSSVTRNHGKSAPARVNPQRRPGCWQPDSHGRWRSLRIGSAARPAPLAASRG